MALTTPQIADLEFALMYGRPDIPANGVEGIDQRPGENRLRFCEMGSRAEQAQIRTIAFHATDDLSGDYKDTQGLVVDVISPLGTTYADCMVERVEIIDVAEVLYEGSSQIKTEADWTIHRTRPDAGGG